MDREQALRELPTAHAVALRLRHVGAGDSEIAAALGIPIEGVRAVLEVAEAKLAAVWAEDAAQSSAAGG